MASLKAILAGAGQILLAPWWAAELLSAAKTFEKNPILGNSALNRLGLHVARMRLAHAMSDLRRQRLAHLVSTTDRAAFDRDGFVLKHDFLPKTVFQALRREILSCVAPARDMLQGNTVTRRIALDARTLANLPATRDFINHAEWLGLVRYVASSKVMPLSYIQTIFTQIVENIADPQTRLHSDTFHSTVKAWLFLTDVTENGGPFTYVPGSHRLTPERLEWEYAMSIKARHAPDQHTREGSFRIAASELSQLGLASPRVFAVPANTLVVADTFGFHARGASSSPAVRVEIWAYGRRNPFLPWNGFDPAGMPGIKGRAVPLFWRMGDAMEWLGLGKNPWRRVGLVTPGTFPDIAAALLQCSRLNQSRS